MVRRFSPPLGLGLSIVVAAIAAIIAYLAVKAHGAGYATFSVRAVGTWYVHVIQTVAIVMVAVGIASLLNVGIGAAAGAEYSFPASVGSGDYPSIVYDAVVIVGTGLIVLFLHQRFERLVDPDRAGVVARRFRLMVLWGGFGIAAILLLLFSGLSLVEYHVGSPGEAAGDANPGRLLSGLAVVVLFWIHAQRALRRELDSHSE